MGGGQRNTGQVVQSMKSQLNSLYVTIIAGGVAAVIIIIFLLLLSALPLASLIIGALKINNCPIQSMIPIWLIVGGVVGLIMIVPQIISLVFKILRRKNKESNDERSAWESIVNCFSSIVSLFSLAWMIAGCVWILSVKSTVQLTDPTSTNYCDSSAYNFAFGLIITQLSIIGLALICICCIPCIVIIVALALK